MLENVMKLRIRSKCIWGEQITCNILCFR